MSHRLVVPLLLLALSGCSSNAPIPVGLLIGAEETFHQESQSYRILSGQDPVASKGVLGVGSSCPEAGQSQGARLETIDGTRTFSTEVVGKTPWDHPLMPGKKRTFSENILSIIAETVVTQALAHSEESFNKPNNTPSRWDETNDVDLGRTTDAAYYGIAADEYVVKVTDLDLFNGLVDTGVNVFPDVADESFLGQNRSSGQRVDLMTRHKPKKGDVWSSVNGNVLFFYKGHEKQTVGGKSRNTDRVEVMTTVNVDTAAGSVMDQCLVEGRFNQTSSDRNGTNVSVDMVNLDSGCATNFIHQQIGTEWWVDDMLVKSEKTMWFVRIDDFGYEWYDQPGGSGSCTRLTSQTRDQPQGDLFVEYTVTMETRSFKVKSWEKK